MSDNPVRYFTGNMDADRLILSELDDRELFSLCIPKNKTDTYSKYSSKLCNEDFWRNRLVEKFPFTLIYKPKDMSWKKYYASIVYYISEMKSPDFMKRLGFNFTFDAVKYQGNPKTQYETFKIRASPNMIIVVAARRGELGIVKFLIDKGTDSLYKFAALGYASENGHLDVVKFLVENGDIDSHGEALVRASGNGKLEIVKYLLEKGADIHSRIYDNDSLALAIKNGHLSLVKFLVENGANIHARDDYALRLARKTGHIHMLNYLESIQN